MSTFRFLARLIRSKRAGVGKSHYKKNLCSKLRDEKKLAGKDITIPLYKTISADDIIARLADKLGNGYITETYNTIHIDIAHEVWFNLNLFNIVVLNLIFNLPMNFSTSAFNR